MTDARRRHMREDRYREMARLFLAQFPIGTALTPLDFGGWANRLNGGKRFPLRETTQLKNKINAAGVLYGFQIAVVKHGRIWGTVPCELEAETPEEMVNQSFDAV